MTEKITTHIEDGLKRIIEQDKSATNIKGLLTAFMSELPALEDAFFELLENRSIDTAEGRQLDLIGTIVGVTRKTGQSDASYKISIDTQISINTSQGQAESVIKVFLRLSESDNVILHEIYPCRIQLMTTNNITDQDLIDEVYEAIERVLAVGVGVEYLGYYEGAETFSFESELAGKGFGDLDDVNVGGKLAQIWIKS